MKMSIVAYIALISLASSIYSNSNHLILNHKYSLSENAESLDFKRDMEKMQTLVNDAASAIDANENDFYYPCLKAFGNNAVCKCLAKERPMIVSFYDYIAIITTDKQELLSKFTTEKNKNMINLIYTTRDKCVNKK